MNNLQYRPFMIINATVDICSALNGVSNPFVNFLTRELRTYSNLLQPCPLRGHLYIKEHDQDISDYPPILPAGFYHSIQIYYTIYKNTERVIFQDKIHFEIIPKGIERF